MPDIVHPHARFGGLVGFRWDGSDPDAATKAMAIAIVDAGAPLYLFADRIVTLNATGEVMPVDVSTLRRILGQVIGRVRMARMVTGAGKVTWREEGEAFSFTPNEALITREPTQSVLQRLLDHELPPLVTVLAH